MAKIECSNLKCKYMSDKGVCKLKKINLSLIISSRNQDYLKCNSFEKDDEYKKLESIVYQLLK